MWHPCALNCLCLFACQQSSSNKSQKAPLPTSVLQAVLLMPLQGQHSSSSLERLVWKGKRYCVWRRDTLSESQVDQSHIWEAPGGLENTKVPLLSFLPFSGLWPFYTLSYSQCFVNSVCPKPSDQDSRPKTLLPSQPLETICFLYNKASEMLEGVLSPLAARITYFSRPEEFNFEKHKKQRAPLLLPQGNTVATFKTPRKPMFLCVISPEGCSLWDPLVLTLPDSSCLHL